MDCGLCERPIKDYDRMLNHLDIDGTHSVEICRDCLDRILKWQQGVYARLFPTNAAKKRFGK
jgi:hypothetical protein